MKVMLRHIRPGKVPYFDLNFFLVKDSNAIPSILLSEFVCTNTLVLVTIFREIQGNRILQRF